MTTSLNILGTGWTDPGSALKFRFNILREKSVRSISLPPFARRNNFNELTGSSFRDRVRSSHPVHTVYILAHMYVHVGGATRYIRGREKYWRR